MTPNYFFEINHAANKQFMARFMYNAEPIVWSETLTSKSAAQTNIASVKKHACVAPIIDITKGESGSGYRFEIFGTKNDQFMVRFKASNNETVVVSETYTTKQNAINAANSVRSNSANAEIRDNTISEAAE